MKITLDKINSSLNLSLNKDEVEEIFNTIGHEVEGTVNSGEKLSSIITAKITKIEPHPNADKLVITEVDDGTTKHQIVTGATNISVGDIIPVSLPGATLSNGMKIKKAKLRGIPSNGMMCSESELGISDQSSGIWILPSATPIGINFIDYAALNNDIFDLSILPNRGDCNSYHGLLREVAAFHKKEFSSPLVEKEDLSNNNQITIENKIDALCPLYTATVISNIDITKDTPIYIQKALAESNINRVNIVVDILNYVMLETGQPLHAFDAKKLDASKIEIDISNQETVKTIAGDDLKLTQDSIVIKSNDNIVAIAGITGLENSEVDNSTNTIVLESALFDADTIRKSARQLNVNTDSSYRFERYVDPENVKYASQFACKLIMELADGELLGSAENKNNDSDYFKQTTLPLDVSKINRLLNTTLTETDINSIISNLGFRIDKDQILIPSWRRFDVENIACISEEILRFIGIDSIESILDTKTISKKSLSDNEYTNPINTLMKNQGFSQVLTYPFISKSDFAITSSEPATDTVTLANPISPREEIMRAHMLPSLLIAASHNYRHQIHDFKFFELGKTYTDNNNECVEQFILAALLSGDTLNDNYKQSTKIDIDFAFSKLKSILSAYVDINYLVPQKTDFDFYEDGSQCEIYFGSKKIAEIGKVANDISKKYRIKSDCFYFQIYIDALNDLKSDQRKFEPISVSPTIKRDISFIVKKDIEFQLIKDFIETHKDKLCVDYYLFDYFESETIGSDNKSFGITFVYQDKQDTLSDDVINGIHEKFSKQFVEKLPITFR